MGRQYFYIYAIRLAGDRFSIGKTTRINGKSLTRLGGTFARRYKPIAIEECYISTDQFDEERLVLKYMSIYGIDRARGGSFKSIRLDQSTREMIDKMILREKGICVECRRYGHTPEDCGKVMIFDNPVPRLSHNSFGYTENTLIFPR